MKLFKGLFFYYLSGTQVNGNSMTSPLKRFLKLFKRAKRPVRRSKVFFHKGGEHHLKRACEMEVRSLKDVHITSISVTRVDHAGMKGYVDDYMIAMSYDYEE